MESKEILAPAGSREALEAAVLSGADAVYLGVGNFNARRNAQNFTKEDLPAITEYCHIHGVNVHLTLNTLCSDNELPEALELVKCGCASGVDAFIIQDLGLARLVHKLAPDMPLHASTQMAVMSPAGFQALEELGFTRAVLPRELSLREIKEIRKATTMELELFIHGALCMCVSGQCYLSAMLGGRSGNRGLCAQPCRLKFEAPGGTRHDLSLKDLSIIEHLPELAAAGISSFKIEGRMKRPEYVAAAVTACQKALRGEQDPALEQDLRAVFSRSGFTDGYFTGHRGVQMFGTRQKDDVTAAAPVLEKLSSLYAEDHRQAVLDMTFSATVGSSMELTVSCFTEQGPLTASVKSENPVSKAQNKAATAESVEKQLRKTGGTGYQVEDLDITLEGDCFLPVSSLNELRRNAIAKLNVLWQDTVSKDCAEPDAYLPQAMPLHQAAELSTLLRVSGFHQIPDRWLQEPAALQGLGLSAVIVPVQTPDAKLLLLQKAQIPFAVELPRALYGNNEKIHSLLETAKGYGAKFVLAGNLDGVILAKEHGLPIYTNFGINAYNSLTLSELEALGVTAAICSAELPLSELNKLKGTLRRGILSYGRLPLMLTRNCPVKNGTDCSSCHKDRGLTDRKGIFFPVQCNNGVSELLNSVPIQLADRQTELWNLDFQLLYCTTEEKEEIEQIALAYKDQETPTGDFTRGLYFRGVQ